MIKMLNGNIVVGIVAWEDYDGAADYFKVKALSGKDGDRLIVCKFARGGLTIPTPQGLSVQVDQNNPVDIPAKGDRVVLTRASENPEDSKYNLSDLWVHWEDFSKDGWARDASVVYTVFRDGQVTITDTLYEIAYKYPKDGMTPDDLADANWEKTANGKKCHCPDPRPNHDAFAYARTPSLANLVAA